MLRVLIFSVCVLAANERHTVNAKVVDLPQRCCNSGSQFGSEGKECSGYPSQIAGIASTEQKLCKNIFQFCCDREYNLRQCKLGVLFAKSFHHCTFANETGATSGHEASECCTACILAESLMEAQLECQLPVSKDATYSTVFQNCCVFPTDNEPPDYDSYDEYPSKNLCELLPGKLCTDICVPTANSYICKCREGFILMEDQKTCQPEKSKVKPTVPTPAVIVPNPERPVPLKKPPLQRAPLVVANKTSCRDGNPCEQECLNAPTGQACACRPGYELQADGIHCKDINECLDNIHVCDPSLEVCLNEIGSYRCETRNPSVFVTLKATSKISTTPTPTTMPTLLSPTGTGKSTVPPPLLSCPNGFEKMASTCTDIDECDSTKHPEVCEPNEACINTQGSYECRCEGGFYKETSTGPCIDINECQHNRHSCLPEQRCDNTVGSYLCHRVTSCGTGYTLNANSGQCEDDDECLLKTDTCRFLGPNYQCRNTLGSFRCERKRCQQGDYNCSSVRYCPIGFQENAYGQCIDIDECKENMHNCDVNSESCINQLGSFECKKFRECSKGFKSTPYGCSDIDECATGQHNCDSSSECRNHNGGFSCSCLPGYHSVGPSQCADYDECLRQVCPQSADCENLPGSYRCICKAGYRQTGPNYCEDEDECSTPGLCQHFCQNTYGSYRCSCKNGFRLNENNRSCDDVDECQRFRDQRLCAGECVNVPGSFTCSCPPGYTLGGDGRTCQDIDECAKHPCRGQDEVCLNTRGSFACNAIRCPPGYKKDNEQRNRCIRLPCMDNIQECIQKPTTYSFNFITFVSMLPIPPMGYLDLFTMRGPLSPGSISQFDLQLLEAKAPDSVQPAVRSFFQLRNLAWNQAVVALTRTIPGPQTIDLQLTASVFHNNNFAYKAVARLSIHVSQYEY